MRLSLQSHRITKADCRHGEDNTARERASWRAPACYRAHLGSTLGDVSPTRELLHLTPVYEQVEGGWTQAGLLELPGVITAAPSRDEAEDMLLDALREFLLSFGDSTGDTTRGPTAPADAEGLTLSVTIERSPAA